MWFFISQKLKVEIKERNLKFKWIIFEAKWTNRVRQILNLKPFRFRILIRFKCRKSNHESEFHEEGRNHEGKKDIAYLLFEISLDWIIFSFCLKKERKESDQLLKEKDLVKLKPFIEFLRLILFTDPSKWFQERTYKRKSTSFKKFLMFQNLHSFIKFRISKETVQI
jgi:hypothetical protein